MQINPFGFPLGAGTQSMPISGVAGSGFAEALGVAIEGGIPQPAVPGTASMPNQPTPQGFDLALTATLPAAAPAPDAPAKATATLPGLQQTTSLAQLMATAAKLPIAGQQPIAEATETMPSADMPAELPAPDTQPATAGVKPVPAAASPAPGPTKATQPALVAAQPEQISPDAEATPEGAAPASVGKSAEPAAKPQKGRVRTGFPEADPAQPADAKQALPAETLAAPAAPQANAQPQQQLAARETAAPRNDGIASPGKKLVAMNAPADSAAGTAPAATGTAFARAVAARGESAGSKADAEGRGSADARPGLLGRSDPAAPQFPQPTHAAAPASEAARPAPTAEPVIDARAGTLGHSLGVEIARKVELGEETLRIRLNPIELGRIEVTLAFDDKGGLQATVRTESAQAMDLLRQDAPDLARTLDQAGVRTDAQSFRFENRAGDGGGQQAQHQHQQNRGGFAASDDDALLAAEPVYRPIRSDGQVDLLA